MKKTLLVMFLLVFAGIGLAETPRIVNPPRPTRKFKKLLVIKHLDYRYDRYAGITNYDHTHFIYTDNFKVIKRVLTENTWRIELLLDHGSQKCVSNFSTQKYGCSLEYSGDYISCYDILYYGQNQEFLQGFFVTKAPHPLSIPELFVAREVPYSLKPNNTKVVFTK